MNSTKHWTQDLQEAIRSLKELRSYLQDYQHLIPETNDYPLLIPLPFLKKIVDSGVDSPLWKQFIPHQNESDVFQKRGLKDPIGDHDQAKTPRLVHRYKNRALFFPTNFCPIICRFCFRKNELYQQDGNELFHASVEESFIYLKNHPEIEEVILSGGDPLILSDAKLESYFLRWSEIASIKRLRFHTRTPVILPHRFDAAFFNLIKKYQPRFQFILSIHLNHLDEIDSEVKETLKNIQATIPMTLVQTVLLKGVNDSVMSLKELFNALAALSIRPYYLHHPDYVLGGLHFFLPLETGRRIYHQLRDEISGWYLPHYVVDMPKGRGKNLAYNSEGFTFQGKMLSLQGELTELAEDYGNL